MPTGRNPKQRPSSIPQQVGPSRGSSSVAALVAQQQEQQAQFTKLLQTMEKMQQENQEQVAAAAQAGGAGATQVANQVTQALEQQRQEKARTQERSEDKQFAIEQQELNAKLQSSAAKEAAAMGQAIMGQRNAMMRYRDTFMGEKAAMDGRIASFGARTDEMLAAGWFSTPDGRKQLAQRVHLQDMMEANSEDHFDDRHLSAAYQLHNKNVQALIKDGESGMDLSTLVVEPLQLPMAQVQDSGKTIAPVGSVSPEKMFEMKLYGGYPANGIVFNEEENFGLPEGYAPRLADADTVLEVLARDDYLRMANDTSLRQELERKNQEIVVEAMDRLQPMKEVYEGFNKTFNPMAGPAVERALEDFLADENPHKFNDMGRDLTSRAVREIFGGGDKGEKMALIAMEMFDGKREMKTPEEMFGAMALESALFNIKSHMMNEFQGNVEGGGLAAQLVKEMQEQLGEDQANLALGVPGSAVGLVRAQDAMQGRLSEAYAFANRMHQGMWKGSALTQFRDNLRKFTRLSDVYSFKHLQEGENKAERANHLIGIVSQEAQFAGIEEDVASLSPQELTGQGRVDRSGVGKSLSMMDSLIGMAGDLGPDTLNQITAFVTGGLDAPVSPNIAAYKAQNEVEMQRSGFVKAAHDVARFQYDRNQKAKEARESVGESFEQGGAVGVVAEQVPALLSTAFQGTQGFAGRTLVGLTQNVAGRQAAQTTARGVEVGQGRLPLPFPGETAQMGNLSLEEKQQVIRESNQGN